MGARRGWQELAVPPPPLENGKFFFLLYGGSFHSFFLLMGVILLSTWGPCYFFPCGGSLFLHGGTSICGCIIGLAPSITQASTHTIINLASSNPLKGIQMETIWKLYRTCTLPMITYGSEAWIMNNQEKQQIQSINNKNLKTILMTPNTTPGIALRTETAMADITQEIDLKQIKYLISQENRGLNNHIKNSIWEKKLTGTCMQHNVDIDHLKTLENLKQREELKTKIQTSRMQTLLADNQNKSKTTNILSNRNADNIDTLPKYMTSLCRKECSAVFRYKCRMLDVKGNFPGGLENILCSYCDTGTETQIHIMQECPHFIDLTRELDLTKLDENQNLEFKKEANILRQITDRLKNPATLNINTYTRTNIIQTTVITPLQGLSSLI